MIYYIIIIMGNTMMECIGFNEDKEDLYIKNIMKREKESLSDEEYDFYYGRDKVELQIIDI